MREFESRLIKDVIRRILVKATKTSCGASADHRHMRGLDALP